MSEENKTYTVTQAMNAAKRGLEQIRLTVVGEVSEFNDKPGYKAAYFTIRDDACSMPCIMWRDVYNASGVQLHPGLLVELTGNFSAYTAKGRMQFSVRRMSLAGEGKLRMQVAELAARLEREGLMDAARKRPSPALPTRIAVITSPRGKAVHDVIRTLRRRYPLGELMVFGVPVEGADAPRYLSEAIVRAQRSIPAPDVILLVRGGGSYEDLMPFNDEGLARTIAASTIPIVTGIGHEPDNSIADMVSDRRCSTPTAAAEAVAPSVDELRRKIANAARAVNVAYANRVHAAEHRLARLSDRPVWTDRHYLTESYLQTLDNMSDRLARAIPDALTVDAHRLEMARQRLAHALPDAIATNTRRLQVARDMLLRAMPDRIASDMHHVEMRNERLRHAGSVLMQKPGRELALKAAMLDALSPLKTLSRGYSIAYADDGRTIVSSVQDIQEGENMKVRVADGLIECNVVEVERVD